MKKKSPVKKPIERVIKLNKEIDKYWNAESQLVFKAKDNRVVYATYRDDKLSELNEDDIMMCEQYGFKYEKSTIEEEEVDEEQEQEEEIEEKKEVEDKKKKEAEDKKKKEAEDKKKKETEDKKKKKEVEDKSVSEKKSLSTAIDENNLKAKDIENILNELQLSNQEDDEDDDEEEEYIEEETNEDDE